MKDLGQAEQYMLVMSGGYVGWLVGRCESDMLSMDWNNGSLDCLCVYV